MRIFVSHSFEDSELAAEVVKLLRLGIGVAHDDVFLSSDGVSIPNGVFFVQHIIEALRSADLVIALLSRSYFKSQFCNAEVGAGQLRRAVDATGLFTLMIPPASFADLGGVLYGTQSGKITDPRELSKLRDLITHALASHPDTSTWEKARDEFLFNSKEIISRNEVIAKVKPDGGWIKREPGATYRLKVRLRFGGVERNIEIGPTTWVASGDSIPLYRPLSALSWQFYDGSKWVPGDGEKVLAVPKHSPFRTWVGVLDTIDDEEVLHRFISRRIGTLVTELTVSGRRVQREFAF